MRPRSSHVTAGDKPKPKKTVTFCESPCTTSISSSGLTGSSTVGTPGASTAPRFGGASKIRGPIPTLIFTPSRTRSISTSAIETPNLYTTNPITAPKSCLKKTPSKTSTPSSFADEEFTTATPGTSTGGQFGSTPAPQSEGGNFGSTPGSSTTPSFFGETSLGETTPSTSTGGFFDSTPAPQFGAGGFEPTPGPSTASSFFGEANFSIPTSSTPTCEFFDSTPAPTFGAGGFETTPGPSAAPSSFGETNYGTPIPGTSTGGYFGNTPAPTFGAGGFGPTQYQSSEPSFFGGTSFDTSTPGPPASGWFGNTPVPVGENNFGTGFYSNFPAAPQPSGFGDFGNTDTGAFGTVGPTSSTFGEFCPTAPEPIVIPASVIHNLKQQQVLTSIYCVHIFGDGRDEIMRNWNMLQACWGTGKGYYSNNHPPVEYDHTNPFYRFKSICYNVLPSTYDSDGFVKLHFNMTLSELSPQREVLRNGIAAILGNRPALTVNIENIKAISETESEVMISVTERSVAGPVTKVFATHLANFLNEPMQRQQLTNVGVLYIEPYLKPTIVQLQEYLQTPPPGIDWDMWQAAIIDNPDPEKYVPTPIFGFSGLKQRAEWQRYENDLHAAYFEKIAIDTAELQQRHSMSIAKAVQLKEKHWELQHRVLQIIIKQEVARNAGFPLRPEDEMMRVRLENLMCSVSPQFRAKVQEMRSRVEQMPTAQQHTFSYQLDPSSSEDIKQVLTMQQAGIHQLVETIKKDLENLQILQYYWSRDLSGNSE